MPRAVKRGRASRRDQRPTMVSLRAAAERLACNPQYIKGIAEAIGIQLFLTGKSLVMTEADFLQVAAKIDETSGAPA